MKKKYILVGGSGFVGSALVKLLGEKNCQIFDKENSLLYPEITKIADVRKPKQIVFNNNIDSLVLLAAEHRDDVSPKSLYYDVNVTGTINILNKMDEFNIKSLIFTSSVAIYGLNKNNPDENHSEDAFNDYGKSKWLAEQEIKKWYEKDPEGKSVTIIRPTVIFGEGNRGNVYNLLKQMSLGKFIMIGDGLNKKSMAYIGNIVSFIKNKLELNQKGYEIYNYADKPDFNMKDLTILVNKKMNLKNRSFYLPYLIGIIIGCCFDFLSFILGKNLPISTVRIKKFCATTEFNSDKAHKYFEAPFTLAEGINNTLDHEFNKNQTN